MIHGIENTWPDMGNRHLSEGVVKVGRRRLLNHVGTGGRGGLGVRVAACVLPLVFLLELVVQAPGATGEIFPYKDMDVESAQLIYRESGMYAPGPLFLEPGADGGNGKSYISLVDLKFEADGTGWCMDPTSPDCERQTGRVELAIFEQKSFGDVGVVAGANRFYCCDEDALAAGVCGGSDEGRILFSPDAADIHWLRVISLPPGLPSGLDHDDIFYIQESGRYVVLMANCDSRTGVIRVSGHSEWVNPYGYLPGEAYGYLPFFFFLAVVYLMLGLLWMGLSMGYIKDLLAIQMWATLVLLLGMVETGAQYFDYRDWNMSGTRSQGAQSFAILFGAAKRALSLALVLMVSMGYGIVRPSLGRDLHRIMGLTLVYFITSALSVALKNSTRPDREFSSRATVDLTTLLVFFNSVIMVVFYAWILQSIFGVIQHLRFRRQSAKLRLYLQFRLVLGASFLFGVAWSIFGIIRLSEEETSRKWKSDWTLNSIWEVLYLAVLLAICFLLRPSNNNQRFAFSELSTSDDARDGDYGDILLKSINDDEAEYGGSLDEDDDGKADEFIVTSSGGGGAKGDSAAALIKKGKAAP